MQIKLINRCRAKPLVREVALVGHACFELRRSSSPVIELLPCLGEERFPLTPR